MATMDELKVLGKLVMAAVVEAKLLGLDVESDYLITVFDEIARTAADLREKEVQAEAGRLLEEGG